MNERRREASRVVMDEMEFWRGLRELKDGEKSAQVLTDGNGEGPFAGFGDILMDDIVRRSSGLVRAN